MNAWIDGVLSLQKQARGLSDASLKERMAVLIARSRSGESLTRLMAPVFALAGESVRRHSGLTPYSVQYMAAKVLAAGGIAQMNTGEGKTLAAVMPACLRAIEGRGAHVVTVNEYLAKRDFELNKPVFEALGISVGLSLSGMSVKEKKSAYDADVTYTTATEAGFDYLRDGVVSNVYHRVQRPLYYAIVDEADSVLLDEAVTPMILSSGGSGDARDYIVTDNFVKHLRCRRFASIDDEIDTDGLDCDYVVDERAKNAMLTDRGVSRAERYFRVNNLFDTENIGVYHRILQAISAYGTLERDVDYIVKNERAELIDRGTGRVMQGRRFSAGLHQAIEAREGLEIHQESRVVSSITYQNYFGLYPNLSGMTGTAWTSRRELGDTYGLPVKRVPPNRPCLRIDRPDRYFGTSREKMESLIADVREAYEIGRPVLIGTPNDRVSEEVDRLLELQNIPHSVLNAKQDAAEAELIAEAGMLSRVTVATNMAGRGTDIKLGGGEENDARRAKELGGLLVLGSERQRSRRVDDQLAGRAGRQGDPGESRFFVSREDDVLRLYAGSVKKLDGKAVRRAQNASGAFDASQRMEALKTDCVLQTLRRGFLAERERVLTDDAPDALVKVMAENLVKKLLEKYPEIENNRASFRVAYHKVFGSEAMPEQTCDFDPSQWVSAAINSIDRQRESASEVFAALARAVILQCMDDGWSDFLEAFEILKTGYHLMAMGRADPLQTLVKASASALADTNDWILSESLRRLRSSRLVARNNQQSAR